MFIGFELIVKQKFLHAVAWLKHVEHFQQIFTTHKLNDRKKRKYCELFHLHCKFILHFLFFICNEHYLICYEIPIRKDSIINTIEKKMSFVNSSKQPETILHIIDCLYNIFLTYYRNACQHIEQASGKKNKNMKLYLHFYCTSKTIFTLMTFNNVFSMFDNNQLYTPHSN